MSALAILFLRLERAMHRLDAYLCSHQGKPLEVADAESRAHECERKIAVIEMNRRMA